MSEKDSISTHRRFTDLTGKIFGKLTVTAFHSRDRHSHIQWSCRCECGNEVIRKTSGLTRTGQQSCGCINDPDITGQAFGRLTAVSRVNDGWFCSCSCGGSTIRRTGPLNSGNVRSCGCLDAERIAGMETHGRARTEEYKIWQGIHQRCSNSAATAFDNYGGRGISVSEEWSDFSVFFLDMGIRPSKRHSIERKDNDHGYCKDNCEWATRETQMRNTRRTRNITYNGESLCLTDWSARLGIHVNTLRRRLALWSIERAFTEPVHSSSQKRNG